MEISRNLSPTYDPRNIPAYSAFDASRYLGIPAPTVRSWVYGRYYQTKQGRQKFNPLIKIPNGKIKQLSFTNLVEAHVLRAIRTVHGVSMDKVRDALDYVESELGYQNPLVRAEFRTDGVDLFVNHLGELLAASTSEKEVLHQSLVNHLNRIEVDEFSFASRLFPFGSQQIDLEFESNFPKSVVIDPSLAFGRLVLVTTGIPTVILAERYKLGETMSDLADDYSCETSLIEEAIRWELPMPKTA